MNLRTLAIFGVIVLLVSAGYMALTRTGALPSAGGSAAAGSTQRPEQMSYSDLLRVRDANQIASIEVAGETVKATLKNDKVVTVTTNLPNGALIDSIAERGATVEVKNTRQPLWVGALIGLLPFLLIIGLQLLIMRQMQGGARGAMGLGKP